MYVLYGARVSAWVGWSVLYSSTVCQGKVVDCEM